MKIVCVGYREWALNIYKNISCNSPHNFLFIKSKESYSEELILNYDPDLVFFYGWSWKVSNEIITRFKCLMLHPSPLPKYRGGSPIQNQIINGETKSQVTIFLMNKELDAGPILSKDF